MNFLDPLAEISNNMTSAELAENYGDSPPPGRDERFDRAIQMARAELDARSRDALSAGELRARLELIGLSPAALGRCSGYTRQTVQRWLTPSDDPNARPCPAWLTSWLDMFERLTPEQRLEIWP